MIKDQMEKIYRTIPPEEIPWNSETPPGILVNLVASKKLKPCKVIEFGCGTGNYVLYLSDNGFDASGVDISEAAIEIAKKSASKKGVDCKFIATDVLGDMTEIQDTYDFVYDWEVLHHIYPQDREKYINNVYRLLNRHGLYLSVCFSEGSHQFGYRKTPLDTVLYFSSEGEMIALFKPFFEIEELKTVDIEGKFGPHRAVYAFLKKKQH
jgi:2-polyprenyl-3-methyl-5-hydroxy-6-metoxy-1,4-benzoquinol methylase